jgi:hypothetical protein
LQGGGGAGGSQPPSSRAAGPTTAPPPSPLQHASMWAAAAVADATTPRVTRHSQDSVHAAAAAASHHHRAASARTESARGPSSARTEGTPYQPHARSSILALEKVVADLKNMQARAGDVQDATAALPSHAQSQSPATPVPHGARITELSARFSELQHNIYASAGKAPPPEAAALAAAAVEQHPPSLLLDVVCSPAPGMGPNAPPSNAAAAASATLGASSNSSSARGGAPTEDAAADDANGSAVPPVERGMTYGGTAHIGASPHGALSVWNGGGSTPPAAAGGRRATGERPGSPSSADDTAAHGTRDQSSAIAAASPNADTGASGGGGSSSASGGGAADATPPAEDRHGSAFAVRENPLYDDARGLSSPPGRGSLFDSDHRLPVRVPAHLVEARLTTEAEEVATESFDDQPDAGGALGNAYGHDHGHSSPRYDDMQHDAGAAGGDDRRRSRGWMPPRGAGAKLPGMGVHRGSTRMHVDPRTEDPSEYVSAPAWPAEDVLVTNIKHAGPIRHTLTNPTTTTAVEPGYVAKMAAALNDALATEASGGLTPTGSGGSRTPQALSRIPYFQAAASGNRRTGRYSTFTAATVPPSGSPRSGRYTPPSGSPR